MIRNYINEFCGFSSIISILRNETQYLKLSKNKDVCDSLWNLIIFHQFARTPTSCHVWDSFSIFWVSPWLLPRLLRVNDLLQCPYDKFSISSYHYIHHNHSFMIYYQFHYITYPSCFLSVMFRNYKSIMYQRWFAFVRRVTKRMY